MDNRSGTAPAQARHRFFSWRTWAVSAATATVAALGCQGESQQAAAPPPPDVVVSQLVSDRISDSEVFTGRIQTMHAVDIRPRVTGHLMKIYFKEGEDVNAGDPLFDIDSRPYDAALKLAVAQAAQAQTHLDTAMDTYQRDLASPGAVPAATVKQDEDAMQEAKAAIQAAKATVEAAQLNVTYSHITAPFSGRISRLNVDLNNDILADSTTLASLVQLQPTMYAYFDVDERSLLKLLTPQNGPGQTSSAPFLPHGKVSAEAVKNLHLTLGLANEDPQHFSHPGELYIANNAIDASTGTLRMWGTFKNDAKDLEPNLFARVRVDIGDPHDAFFVSEAALGSDQEFRYVYVVNDKGEAEYTRVEVGPKLNGLIAIMASAGYKPLTKDAIVVVDGLQRIHPVLDDNAKPKPVKVNGKTVKMPSADAAPRLTGVWCEVCGEKTGSGRHFFTPHSTLLTPHSSLLTPDLPGRRPCSRASSSTDRSSPRCCRSSSR